MDADSFSDFLDELGYWLDREHGITLKPDPAIEQPKLPLQAVRCRAIACIGDRADRSLDIQCLGDAAIPLVDAPVPLIRIYWGEGRRRSCVIECKPAEVADFIACLELS